MQTCPRASAPRSFVRLAGLTVAICGIAVLHQQPADAQAIVLAVNGDPITSVDLEQQMKLQRVIHRAPTREAATESLIEDHLKFHEAARYGLNIKDNEIGEEVQDEAKQLKTSPQALVQNIQRAGVSPDFMRYHFKAQLGYAILIKALNKGVEASEVAVRDEMSRDKDKGAETNYTIRQVVFTLNPGDPPSAVEASIKEAQALRGRFSNCDSGIAYAKSLPGVAVRNKLTRSASQLSDGIKELLDKTPIGHLTDPSRSANGIEMVAVCARSLEKNDDALRKTISDRILARHFAEEEARKYREMRAIAVITRNQ